MIGSSSVSRPRRPATGRLPLRRSRRFFAEHGVQRAPVGLADADHSASPSAENTAVFLQRRRHGSRRAPMLLRGQAMIRRPRRWRCPRSLGGDLQPVENRHGPGGDERRQRPAESGRRQSCAMMLPSTGILQHRRVRTTRRPPLRGVVLLEPVSRCPRPRPMMRNGP